MDAAEQAVREILSSRKYAGLCRPLIERVCRQEAMKYSRHKELVKAAKNKLHILYGSFASPDMAKEIASCLQGIDFTAADLKEAMRGVLQRHASTRERLADYEMFYAFILDAVGDVNAIADIGCGLNPFSIPWMGCSIKRYYAFDIDTALMGCMNIFFTKLGLPRLAQAADIITGLPDHRADLALILKLLPVLDGQQRGAARRLLDMVQARYMAISYPVKSLGGREKGMAKTYTGQMEQLLGGQERIIAHSVIGHELVYVIERMV